jgi:hypothetical protein
MVPTRHCVGCGFCCVQGPCEVVWSTHTIEVLRDGWHGCPDLRFRDGRHWCRVLIEATDNQRFCVEVRLSIGAGCCSPLNSWRQEPVVDRRR